MREAFLVFPQAWPAAPRSTRLCRCVQTCLSELQQTSETLGTGPRSDPNREEARALRLAPGDLLDRYVLCPSLGGRMIEGKGRNVQNLALE